MFKINGNERQVPSEEEYTTIFNNILNRYQFPLSLKEENKKKAQQKSEAGQL